MRRRPALPWYLLLWAPGRIQRRLDALADRGLVEVSPNLLQVWQGVLYMWARVLLRPDSIGLSDGAPVRTTPGARRLDNRLVRLPALLRMRAVNPLDQVGLGSSTAHVIRHLLGAYHPGDNALYDLQLLDVDGGALHTLRDAVASVVDGTHPHAELLRDLVVYEGYHERLLAMVDAWLAAGPAGLQAEHPDTTLPAFLAWCADRPATPGALWQAVRRGDYSLLPDDAPGAAMV